MKAGQPSSEFADVADVAIVGAGPGGYVAAIRAAQLGLKTVVIERDSRLGGTCTLRGCIPTKALLRDAHLFQEIRKSVRDGLFKTPDVQFDFEKIQARKDGVVSKSAKGVDFLFRKNGISVIHGNASLISPGKIRVARGDADATEVAARNIILATGSEARALPGYDVDEKRIISNVGALDMKSAPQSMLIVGAGAVGVEFASIYNAFGTKVILLEALPAIVPLEDEEVSKELRRVFTRQGIEVHVRAKLESAQAGEDGVAVVFQTEKGEVRKTRVDVVLMATGRAPNTAGIGLEAVGVAAEKGFVKVDAHMRTNVAGIYAIGDIVPTPLLAHVAFQEGIVAVETIAGRNPLPIDYRRVPNATYCHPQVASVGLTEARAVEAGFQPKTGKFPFSAIGKARIDEATDGFIKIVADSQYGEILGFHMIGANVTELIAEGAAAMNLEGTVHDLVHSIHPHPTMSEGIHEALESVFGAPIHM